MCNFDFILHHEQVSLIGTQYYKTVLKSLMPNILTTLMQTKQESYRGTEINVEPLKRTLLDCGLQWCTLQWVDNRTCTSDNSRMRITLSIQPFIVIDCRLQCESIDDLNILICSSHVTSAADNNHLIECGPNVLLVTHDSYVAPSDCYLRLVCTLGAF